MCLSVWLEHAAMESQLEVRHSRKHAGNEIAHILKAVPKTDHLNKYIFPFCCELYRNQPLKNILALTVHNFITQFHFIEIVPIVL